MTDCQDPTLAERPGERVQRMKLAAPVDPVNDDGVRVFGLGTILFALATIAVATIGQDWFPGAPALEICGVGTLIGLVGFWWCRRRRDRIARERAGAEG